MSSLTSDLLTNLFKSELVMAKRPATDGGLTPGDEEPWSAPQPAQRRRRLWDISGTLHCSIIGTCLSTAEARRVLVRLRVDGAETMSDHDRHNAAVTIASRANDGAKILHKALDRRHQVALHQFAKARDAAAIRELWERALKQGDIPGSYWALLTHPLASDALVKTAFSDVHMLSHLMGAANRADIRRLRQLEDENAVLTAKLDRQQAQLRNGFTERDATIRRMNDALRQALVQNSDAIRPRQTADAAAWLDTIANLDRALTRESARRERLEQRLAAATASLQEMEKTLRRAEAERDDIGSELATLEQRIGTFLHAGNDAPAQFNLHGTTVLYAGGRTGLVPQFRSVIDRVGGHLLHYDGGIDDNPSLLPGLVSQADIVVFPVDCISHGAVTAIKRLAQQAGKRYVPLRTSSVACLVSALSSESAGPTVAR
jgi:hypothetical protein